MQYVSRGIVFLGGSLRFVFLPAGLGHLFDLKGGPRTCKYARLKALHMN